MALSAKGRAGFLVHYRLPSRLPHRERRPAEDQLREVRKDREANTSTELEPGEPGQPTEDERQQDERDDDESLERSRSGGNHGLNEREDLEVSCVQRGQLFHIGSLECRGKSGI